METGFVIWDGVADRLIGRVVPDTEARGQVDVRRLDGVRVRVPCINLRAATHEQVERAFALGTCAIPMDGERVSDYQTANHFVYSGGTNYELTCGVKLRLEEALRGDITVHLKNNGFPTPKWDLILTKVRRGRFVEQTVELCRSLAAYYGTRDNK